MFLTTSSNAGWQTINRLTGRILAPELRWKWTRVFSPVPKQISRRRPGRPGAQHHSGLAASNQHTGVYFYTICNSDVASTRFMLHVLEGLSFPRLSMFATRPDSEPWDKRVENFVLKWPWLNWRSLDLCISPSDKRGGELKHLLTFDPLTNVD